MRPNMAQKLQKNRVEQKLLNYCNSTVVPRNCYNQKKEITYNFQKPIHGLWRFRGAIWKSRATQTRRGVHRSYVLLIYGVGRYQDQSRCRQKSPLNVSDFQKFRGWWHCAFSLTTRHFCTLRYLSYLNKIIAFSLKHCSLRRTGFLSLLRLVDLISQWENEEYFYKKNVAITSQKSRRSVAVRTKAVNATSNTLLWVLVLWKLSTVVWCVSPKGWH